MTTFRIRPLALATATGAVMSLACVAAAQGSAQAAPFTTLTPGTITACTYDGFAPFSELNAEGEWTGWDPAFLRPFAAQNGLTLTPVKDLQFNGIWQSPGKNRCDLAAAGITNLAARRAQSPGVTWSATYYYVLRSFIVRKGSTLTGPMDLAGKTVIVTKGSTADLDLVQQIRQHHVPDVTVRYTDNDENGAKAVAQGRAFAYGSGLGSIQAVVKKHPGTKVAWTHHRLLPNGKTGSEPFSYPVRTASTGLVQALNAYIAANKKNYGK